LEIRFEGQRRIGEFEAIRSASLLRKSILENDQRASTAAGLPLPIQIVCQCSNSNKIVFYQYVIFFAVRQLTGANAPYGGISLRIALEAKLPNIYSGSFPASWSPPENLEGSQVSGDVGRIEYRPGERPD
jgi:hypothetical protein